MKELATVRTDVVGSLLRPAKLKTARNRFDDGKMTLEELRGIEDDCIQEAVKLQEEIGLSAVTDGEYRRLNFQEVSANRSWATMPAGPV
jgi:5-methyltetrahydropteroyltriglutamate--homocysteine methyltransferase